MKYVILIMDTPLGETLSEAERKAWSDEIYAWYEEQGASGKVSDMGAQLHPPATAKTIRGTTVTDGPFVEAKEVVGGYSVLEAGSIDEAVGVAKTWPGVDRGLITIEVRPIVEQPGM
jgi:hypothetical protein